MIDLKDCPFCRQRQQEREKMMEGQDFNVALLKKEKCHICGRSWVELDKQYKDRW